jgi:hypothetical protein
MEYKMIEMVLCFFGKRYKDSGAVRFTVIREKAPMVSEGIGHEELI